MSIDTTSSDAHLNSLCEAQSRLDEAREGARSAQWVRDAAILRAFDAGVDEREIARALEVDMSKFKIMIARARPFGSREATD